MSLQKQFARQILYKSPVSPKENGVKAFEEEIKKLGPSGVKKMLKYFRYEFITCKLVIF